MTDFTAYVSDHIRPHPPRLARELDRTGQPPRVEVCQSTGMTKQALRRRLERKTSWRIFEVAGLAHAIRGDLTTMFQLFDESVPARGPMGRPKRSNS